MKTFLVLDLGTWLFLVFFCFKMLTRGKVQVTSRDGQPKLTRGNIKIKIIIIIVLKLNLRVDKDKA